MEAGKIHLEIRHGLQQGRQFVLGQAVFFSLLGILKARQGHGHPERGGCKNNNNKIKCWKKSLWVHMHIWLSAKCFCSTCLSFPSCKIKTFCASFTNCHVVCR